jgi:hypothetical protein
MNRNDGSRRLGPSRMDARVCGARERSYRGALLWLILLSASQFGAGQAGAAVACGAPDYDATAEAAAYLWRNCASDLWELSVTGGPSGSTIRYTGGVTSGDPLTDVSGVRLERNDSLEQDSPGALSFALSVRGAGQDGVLFGVSESADARFDLAGPAGAVVYVGPDKEPVGTGLDLVTTTPPPVDPADCGQPDYDARAEAAVYLWRDCASGAWQLNITGGPSGSTVAYSGAISSTEPLFDVAGDRLERNDTLDLSDPRQLSFQFNARGAGQDGVLFGVPASAYAELVMTAPDAVPVYSGPDKAPVGSPYVLAGEPPTPPDPPEPPVCGEPVYAAGREAGLFLWRDCDSGLWRLRATAGGGDLTYAGSLVANEPFGERTGFSLEAADDFIVDDPARIDFVLKVRNWGQDGFDFALDPTASAELSVERPTSAALFAGPEKAAAPLPYSIVPPAPDDNPPDDTPPIVCIPDGYDPLVNAGVYLWRSCDDAAWRLRFAGGAQPQVYAGRIVADAPLEVAAVGLETADQWSQATPNMLEFAIDAAAADEDGFDLVFDWNAAVRLELDSPADTRVALGLDGETRQAPLVLSERVPDALAACADIGASLVSAGYRAPVSDYTRAPIVSPVGDGIALEVPDLGLEQPFMRCGMVDVSRPPFNADRSGVRDATEALNAALAYARDLQMVAYFPVGTYRISDTLECAQGLYQRVAGRVVSHRFGPCVLVGSRAGPERAKILLAPDAPGFADPSAPKYAVRLWTRDVADPTQDKSALNMNQAIINLDIEVGAGNSGAIALKMSGAQGTTLQESTLDVGDGLIGIDGPPGGGGSIVDVTVIGGAIGIDSNDRTIPTLTAVTLLDQRRHAIVHERSESLTAVGLSVRVPTGNRGPAVKGSGSGRPTNGALTLVDSEIVFDAPDPANIAVETSHALYLRNVYVRRAQTAARFADGVTLPGNADDWSRIEEYAYGPPLGAWSLSDGTGVNYAAPVYLDGNREEAPLLLPGSTGSEPPSDLQSRHLWSTAQAFPSAESTAAVNVKAPPYSAAGDGVSDDTAAIQRALDENGIVFLPKGYYRISRPIDIPVNGALVGVAAHLSVLLPVDGGEFADPASPQPVVRTADDPAATSTLAFVHLHVPYDVPGAHAVHWRSGADSIYRGIWIHRQSVRSNAFALDADHPMVVISDNGGGRWYNFEHIDYFFQAPGYRHILVDGIDGPLRFYQLNPERVLSEANMEIRNARDVRIFGLKSEGNYPALWIRDSDEIEVLGFGGLVSAFEADASYPLGFEPFTPTLFRVERTANFRLVNLWERAEKNLSGGWANGVYTRRSPDSWHMVYDAPSGAAPLLTETMDRPVLYRRGYAVNSPPQLQTSALTVPEGSIDAGTVLADDADGDPLAFRLTGNGADDALLTIDAASGALRFAAAPVHASPADADGDNVYVVEVEVGDGTDTAVGFVAVTVTPL